MRYLIYLLPILYILSPYDILPDFMVGLGWVDDLIVLGFLWWYHFVYRRKIRAGPSTQGEYQHSKRENPWGFREDTKFHDEVGSKEAKKEKAPHEVLGVERGASIEQIKVAYRELANQYHPDKVMHLGEEFKILAEKRFKEIQKAYQELSEKR
jgi:uncharacterized membrane protein YkvA (DUF1232 family)